MAITITVAALASAIRVGTSAAETAEITRLRVYAIQAITDHLGATAYAAAPESVVNEAAVRLVGYLYDQPTVGRGPGFGAALKNSGAGRMLLRYRVHRAGTTADETAAASGGDTGGETPSGDGTSEARVREIVAELLAAHAALPNVHHVPPTVPPAYSLPAASASTRGGVLAVTNDIIDTDTSTGIFGWAISHVKRGALAAIAGATAIIGETQLSSAVREKLDASGTDLTPEAVHALTSLTVGTNLSINAGAVQNGGFLTSIGYAVPDIAAGHTIVFDYDGLFGTVTAVDRPNASTTHVYVSLARGAVADFSNGRVFAGAYWTESELIDGRFIVRHSVDGRAVQTNSMPELALDAAARAKLNQAAPPAASTTVAGVSEYSTQDEIDAETNPATGNAGRRVMDIPGVYRAISRKVKTASTTVRGLVLLARNSDIDATDGSGDDSRTPDLAGAKRLIERALDGPNYVGQDQMEDDAIGAAELRDDTIVGSHFARVAAEEVGKFWGVDADRQTTLLTAPEGSGTGLTAAQTAKLAALPADGDYNAGEFIQRNAAATAFQRIDRQQVENYFAVEDANEHTDEEVARLERRIAIATKHPDPIELHAWPVVPTFVPSAANHDTVTRDVTAESGNVRSVLRVVKGSTRLHVVEQDRANSSSAWRDTDAPFQSVIGEMLGQLDTPPASSGVSALRVFAAGAGSAAWNTAAPQLTGLVENRTFALAQPAPLTVDVAAARLVMIVAKNATGQAAIRNSNFIGPSSASPAPFGATRLRMYEATAAAAAVKAAVIAARETGKFHFADAADEGADTELDVASVLPAAAADVGTDPNNGLLRFFNLTFATGTTVYRPAGAVEIVRPPAASAASLAFDSINMNPASPAPGVLALGSNGLRLNVPLPADRAIADYQNKMVSATVRLALTGAAFVAESGTFALGASTATVLQGAGRSGTRSINLELHENGVFLTIPVANLQLANVTAATVSIGRLA